jgi:epoxyqueuosine reductase QueG
LHGEKLTGLTAKLKDFARHEGATLVGITSVKKLSTAPKKHRPIDFLPNAKSAVSIGLRINRSSILQLPETIREYKIDYEITNIKLNALAWEVSRFLEDLGYPALAIPASLPYDKSREFGDMSHKHVAVAAGLGTFGLNNLVLTPEYGPYIRFVTVITDAPLRSDKPLTVDICLGEKCLKCVKACPPKALENATYNANEGWRMNKEKCHDYMHIISSGDVCGLCIKACPVARR